MLLLKRLNNPLSKLEMMTQLQLKDSKYFRQFYLSPAMEQGVIEMTISDKPRSRNQKYRLTNQALALLQMEEFEDHIQ